MGVDKYPLPCYSKFIGKEPTMTLEQAKANFQKADHAWQLAWAAGDPTEMVAAKKARQAAFNKLAKLVEAQMVK